MNFNNDICCCFLSGLPISPLFPYNYTLQDIKISRTLVRYLSNFAHTGNPNESPSSMMHISQTKHNHIATENLLLNRLSKSTVDQVGAKQKRQMLWSVSRRRKKRNRNFNYYDNDEDSDESEHEEENEYDSHYSHNRDRLEETNDQPYPFWDMYDTLNQYYLEVGSNKFEMKNHYRGHKLSLWLNLIPQLHNPGELNEMSMKHHHFQESDSKFYDGIVRAQTIEKPVFIKPINLKNEPSKSMAVTTTVLAITGIFIKQTIICKCLIRKLLQPFK